MGRGLRMGRALFDELIFGFKGGRAVIKGR